MGQDTDALLYLSLNHAARVPDVFFEGATEFLSHVFGFSDIFFMIQESPKILLHVQKK